MASSDDIPPSLEADFAALRKLRDDDASGGVLMEAKLAERAKLRLEEEDFRRKDLEQEIAKSDAASEVGDVEPASPVTPTKSSDERTEESSRRNGSEDAQKQLEEKLDEKLDERFDERLGELEERLMKKLDAANTDCKCAIA